MTVIERQINSLTTAEATLRGLQGQNVHLDVTALRIEELRPLSLLCKGINIVEVRAPSRYLKMMPEPDGLIFNLFNTDLVSFMRPTQFVWSAQTCRVPYNLQSCNTHFNFRAS